MTLVLPADAEGIREFEYGYLPGQFTPAQPVSPDRYPWEPYDPADFERLLGLAVGALPAGAPAFCDVGAGIGSKVVMAARAGCVATGLECIADYVSVAAELGASVTQGEAEFQSYSAYDIVYVNCPFMLGAGGLSDYGYEQQFETWLQGQLRPGAVLIQVNDCAAPPGWQAVIDERPAFRGVYIKPGG